MAINFPNAPSSGQVYEYGDYTYTFDGVKWTSILRYGLAAAKVSSETPPPNPEAGLMWYVPSTGDSYLYYVDEDGGQWIQENPSIGAVAHGLLEGVNDAGAHEASAVALSSGNSVQYESDDRAGFDAALYAEAGITDSGIADTAVASQRLDATKKIIDIRSIARSLNVSGNEVIHSTDTSTVLDNVLYIYDETAQVTWEVPTLNGTGETIISVTNDSLVTSGGSYDLILGIEEKTQYTLEDFGAKGDARLFNGAINPSPTDNTAVIQKALRFCALNNRAKLVAQSWASYRCDKVYLVTPYRAPDVEFLAEGVMVIDFQGAEFIGGNTTSATFMESGYIDINGDIQSVIGTANEFHLTAGYQLQNINLYNYHRGFNLKGLVYGSALKSIFCIDVQQAIKTNRCFYTHFEQITCKGSFTIGLPRFSFNDNNNIMPLKGLVSGNCDIGYEFTGAMEALRMVDCGVEGFSTVGVITDGSYNIKFDSCYFEGGQGAGYISLGGTPHVTFENCWGLGDFPMIGSVGENTKIKINNNNNISGDCRWYDSLPAYCVADFELSSEIRKGGIAINTYDATDAVNINQDIAVYNAASGLADVLGRVEQTNDFHTQRVNGRIGTGFRPSTLAVGHIVSIDSTDPSNKYCVYTTGITDVETQLIYVAMKTTNAVGTYSWLGLLCGSTFTKLGGSAGSASPTKSVVDGMVVITSPSQGASIGPLAGEVRIL